MNTLFKDTILPVVTLLIGTGLFTNILMSYKNQKNSISIKVIEQYFKAREEITANLCILANLKASNVIDVEIIDIHKNELSNLYYKYYDILPEQVLLELNCLFSCLSDENGSIYTQENKKLHKIQYYELEIFLERISLVENFKYIAAFILNSKDKTIRRSACINYQARSVLHCMNEYFTIESFLNWTKHIIKKKI